MKACKARNHNKEIIFRNFYLNHRKLGENEFEIISTVKLEATGSSYLFQCPTGFCFQMSSGAFNPHFQDGSSFSRVFLWALDCRHFEE